jgi:phosphoribosylamine--glycine ligase
LAIRDLGIPYRGVLYAGIIVTDTGPKCIEFNCRLGDPETQALLPMLESDLFTLFMSVIDGTLEDAAVAWRQGSSVCVVAASEGYPNAFDPGSDTSGLLGRRITGIEEAAASQDCAVFHSGTRLQDGAAVTSGGRVLSVTGMGEDLLTAAGNAYICLDRIHFNGMHYRKDIAARALR